MNNFKVYVHINKVNGKRYYGITGKEVNKRWANGKGYTRNKYFNRAINKYGWNNFEHIVIAKGLNEEEAKWLEIELIREWNTTNKDKGYNITLGGESFNGYKITEEHRKKLSEANKGKTISKETRKKSSESHKGYKWTEEQKQKLSEANKGKNNPNATKVYCVELNMVFNTITEASEYVGCNKSGISNCLHGKRKTCGGYHWLHTNDIEKERVS